MLPSSGNLALSAINVELRLPATSTIGLNDTRPRGLANKSSGQISVSDFYGKEDRIAASVTISANTRDYVLNPSAIPGYIAGIMNITFVINSGVVMGASNTSTAGLTVTGFSATDSISIINNGYIVGAGGNGGYNGGGAGGGVALVVQSSISVTNNGTIGGGGGGGGGAAGYTYTGGYPPSTKYASPVAGGGGAGDVAGNSASLTAGGGGASTGGALGSPGGSSSWGGGVGGSATSGNSLITWITAGTRLGALN